MAGRRPKILDFLLFSIKNKYKYFKFYLEFQWLFYFSAQFKDVFMTLMTIFQFNDILMTSRNLMTGGHPERSGGTPVGGHSRLFEGTPLNILTDFTNNDLSCRAIDFKKLPLCIQILNIF